MSTAVKSHQPAGQPPAKRDPGQTSSSQQLDRARVIIAAWQLVLALVTVAGTFVVWPVVDALDTPTGATVRLGALTLTPTTGAVLLGLVGGLAGSLVHTILIFGHRTGRGTLEASYLWWYVQRPFAAALLAMITVAGVHSGLVALGGDTGSTPVVAYLSGGLAGLFTDSVMQRLRQVLGATSPEELASRQHLPIGAGPTPITAET